MSRKTTKTNKESDVKNNRFINRFDVNIKNDIEKLFDSVKKGDEFEFIFFSKKGSYLPQEKYIQILKYFIKRSEKEKYEIVKPTDTLDIIYRPDFETNYRCTIENSQNINKLMKKVILLKNHVIFKTLLDIWKKDGTEKTGISTMKKIKESENVVDINDYDLRIRASKEEKLSKSDIENLSTINETTLKKINYRYKQRTSIYVYGNSKSNEFIRVDLTVTRMSNVFNKINQEIPNYELEIEYGTTGSSKREHLDIMFNEAEILLKIIQQSNYIISKTTSNEVLTYYMNLFSTKTTTITSLETRNAETLEIQHVTELLPNKYAVTDKADGDRHFLIIYNNRIYLIDTNTNVKDTGIVIDKSLESYNGSIMDGELIFISNQNRHIFLVFDCLFYKSQDIRSIVNLFDRIKKADDIIENCFIFEKQIGFQFKDFKFDQKKFDLDKISDFYTTEISKMIENLNHDIQINKQYVLIRRKFFIGSTGATDWEISKYATTIWNAFTRTSTIKCPYFLDGLIFQPLEQPHIANRKESNKQDYKWKPPEKNSIDFYIEFEKDKDGKIQTIYDNSYDDFVKNKPYKICNLYVGHRDKNEEIPVLFKDDYDLASAYIFLVDGDIRDIDGNILSDKTVVEFYYNNDPELYDQFRWVPIRTRYDKTESVIRHHKKYGNYSLVADKVWRSIVNPILMTDFDELAIGNIPEKNIYTYDKKVIELRAKIGHELIISATKENVYYQKKTKLAHSMKQFHNFIKSDIIYTYCHPMYQNNKQLSVLDIACGRGGDTLKFYYAKVAFYVGIDIDKEGLISAVDGAISRYNQFRKKHPNFPKMYFIQADATALLNIESQKNALNVKKLENEDFFKKFFSNEQKEKTLFDIINCQFAIHYMLKNNESWQNFKININNHLRNGGFLLATTFDAEKIINLIGNNDKFTQEYTDENGKSKILFEIVKKYENPPNQNKETLIGVGNTIDVYMSWISQEGRYLPEYLVDAKYIKQDLEKDCNLELIDTDSFANQYIIHEPFFLNYVKYEEIDETRQFLTNVSTFYKSDSINDGCKIWNGLFRYYVFRKKDKKIKQKGGDNEFDSENLINFTDSDKFTIPNMTKYNYNNEFSCINSIHHILQKHSVIPKTISPEKMCSDLGISMVNDNNVSDNLNKIAKHIIIEHVIDDKKDEKQSIEKIIDGLNIFIVERDCNNAYNVDLIKNKKKISDNDSAIILMKEGTLYVPIYYNDSQTISKTGLYEMNHSVIKKLQQEL